MTKEPRTREQLAEMYRTEHSDAVKIIAFAGGVGLLQTLLCLS